MSGLHTLGSGAKVLSFTPAAKPKHSHSHAQPTAQQVSLSSWHLDFEGLADKIEAFIMKPKLPRDNMAQ